MALVDFAGERFELCASGALYWPARKMLIVSDLHLEKGSSYAAKGIFLPPQETAATLEKLYDVCEKFKPETLLFLGDIFHDRTSLKRIHALDMERFNALLNAYQIIWIEGNHDQGYAPEGVKVLPNHMEGTIFFNHIASDTLHPEISGHYHPSVKFSHKEQKVRRPCFVVSQTKMILPSFGVLTGGLDIRDAAYQPFLQKPYQLYALGHAKVYDVSRA